MFTPAHLPNRRSPRCTAIRLGVALLVPLALSGCQQKRGLTAIASTPEVATEKTGGWDLESESTSPWFEANGFRLELTTLSAGGETAFIPGLRLSSSLRLAGFVQPPTPNSAFALIPGLSISSVTDETGQQIARQDFGRPFPKPQLKAPGFIVPGRADMTGIRVDMPSMSLKSAVSQSLGSLGGSLGLLSASQVELKEVPFASADAIELVPGLNLTIKKAAVEGERNVIVECDYTARNSEPTYDPNAPPHLLYVDAIDESGATVKLTSSSPGQSIVNHQGLHRTVRYNGSFDWHPKPVRSLRFAVATAATSVTIPFELKNISLSRVKPTLPKTVVQVANAARRPVFDHDSFRVEAHQVSAEIYSDFRQSGNVNGSITIAMLLHVPIGNEVWAVGMSPRITTLLDETGSSLLESAEATSNRTEASSIIRYTTSEEGKRSFATSARVDAVSHLPTWLQRIEGEIPIVKASRIEEFDLPFASAEPKELTDGFSFGISRVEHSDNQHTLDFRFRARPDNLAQFWQPPAFFEIITLDDTGKQLDRTRYAKIERTHEGTFGSGTATLRGRKNQKPSAIQVRVVTETETLNIPFHFENWPVGRIAEPANDAHSTMASD